MEYSPPPLFKQGTSARVKVALFSLLSLILLVADSRLRSLTAIREAVGAALYPLQVAAMLPRDGIHMARNYFTTVSTLQRENRILQQERVATAQTLQQARHLAAENEHLLRLLSATERIANRAVLSEILYVARDPFSRKIVLDRGSQHGVTAGNPVIDDIGVVGQITRVYPFTSEVTLLTDKEQAIPVQILRTGLRSIAYGQGHSGALELRFLPTNVDIKSGDVVITSGIDGVYPPGLAVANVVQVETKSGDAFARITCQPLAGIDRHRHLLLLTDQATSQDRATIGSHSPANTLGMPALPQANDMAAKDGTAAAGAAVGTPGASASASTKLPSTPPATLTVPAAPAAPSVPSAPSVGSVPSTTNNIPAPAAPPARISPLPQASTNNAPAPVAPASPQPKANGAVAPPAVSSAPSSGNAAPAKPASVPAAPAAHTATPPTGQTTP